MTSSTTQAGFAVAAVVIRIDPSVGTVARIVLTTARPKRNDEGRHSLPSVVTTAGIIKESCVRFAITVAALK